MSGAERRVALVTGASGFVGRALCAALSDAGWEVRGLARHEAHGPWSTIAAVDLARVPAPPAIFDGVDCVFHLAGRAHAVDERGQDEAVYRAANVEATGQVLDAAGRAEVRAIVFASSVKAMGEGGSTMLDEASPARPVTAYGRSKLEAESLVLDAAGVRHRVVLRLPLVYGPGVKANLSRLLRAVLVGKPPPLPDLGDRRSLIGVGDVARAAMLAATERAAAGRRYIVTDGRLYSTRRIVEAMCTAAAVAPPTHVVPPALLRMMGAAGDVVGRCLNRAMPFDTNTLAKLSASAVYSSQRIARELGFRPAQSLQSTLPAMIAAVRAEMS